MLEVLDFYTLGKFSINKLKGVTMLPASLVVLLKRNGTIKEALFNIPKRYNFKYKRNLKFKRGKHEEYSVLVDFLKSNKEAVKRRFGFTEREFAELLAGLKLVLISKYSKYSFFKKLLIKGKILLLLKLDKFLFL